MSISGNNHSSGNSGSRTSIFEAFHTPSFGDDHFDVQPQPIVVQPIRTYTRQPVIAAHAALTVNSQTGSSSSLQSLGGREDESRTMEQEIFDEDEESSGENAVTTLWMSCSPGRDSTDDEEEEEEEEVAPSQEDEEEDEGEGMEAESSDDGLPLSKLAGKRFLEKGMKPPSVKRNKPPKPLRLRKDKQGPKKPLSAYAFFYRDTQMAIKSQNPQATFGEISKIVASMWDRLDGELKEDYNKRAEENKKEYIKQLAEYCALNKDKISTSAKSKQKKPKKSSSKPKRKLLESDDPSESQFDRVMDESDARDETDDNNVAMSRRSSDSSDRMMSPKQDEKQEKPRPICNYTKCQNPAIDDPRWETNYCSSECVILHCKDVFNAWVANRKTAYCET